MIKIHLDCDPPTATAQMKGIRTIIPKDRMGIVSTLWRGGPKAIYKILRYAQPMHFEKDELKSAKQMFTALLSKHQLQEPILGPVALDMDWVFPWRKTEKKQVTRGYRRFPKDTRPDLDNSNKLLIDCMTFLEFWKDDSQLYDLRLRKWWGDTPGIWINIVHGTELPDPPLKKTDLFA